VEAPWTWWVKFHNLLCSTIDETIPIVEGFSSKLRDCCINEFPCLNILILPSFPAFIPLRQNTLQLAAGMNGGANAPKLEQRRRVGFCEFRFDTPQLAAGRFIKRINVKLLPNMGFVWSLGECGGPGLVERELRLGLDLRDINPYLCTYRQMESFPIKLRKILTNWVNGSRNLKLFNSARE